MATLEHKDENVVATPEKLETITSASNHAEGQNRVAVLLMGYGEVESYEDVAKYNEHS